MKNQVSPCQYSPAMKILRWTRLEKNVTPERILRAWEEKSVLVLPAKTLRIPAIQGQTTMFPNGQNYEELVLMDREGIIVGRFEATDFQKVATDLDPFSDMPSGDGQIFHYINIWLSMPKTPLGVLKTPAPFKYVTNSVAYPAATLALCVNDKGQIVLHSETKNTSRVVLNPEPKYAVEKLAFEFGQVEAASVTESSTEFPEVARIPCIVNVTFFLELKEIGNDEATPLKIQSTFSLPNFATQIPVSCTET